MLEHTHYIAKMNTNWEHKMWQDHGTRIIQTPEPELKDIVIAVGDEITEAICGIIPLFSMLAPSRSPLSRTCTEISKDEPHISKPHSKKKVDSSQEKQEG